LADKSAKFVIFMGPPGAGKGTQAQKVAEALGLAHVSTGDLFREAMAKQTELGSWPSRTSRAASTCRTR
jgi:adenylate kinase family enzyme